MKALKYFNHGVRTFHSCQSSNYKQSIKLLLALTPHSMLDLSCMTLLSVKTQYITLFTKVLTENKISNPTPAALHCSISLKQLETKYNQQPKDSLNAGKPQRAQKLIHHLLQELSIRTLTRASIHPHFPYLPKSCNGLGETR